MLPTLAGKKIAVIGVTAKQSAVLEPLINLLSRNEATVDRIVCKNCLYELHKMGYRKIKESQLQQYDLFICSECWGAGILPKHIPLISITHAFGSPVRKSFTLKNPHYLQNCDYYFTHSRITKEDIRPEFLVFSWRRTDHVTMVPVSSFVFGEQKRKFLEQKEKDCIFFVMCVMRDRGKIDQRVYEYINHVITETPFICVFRPAPGDITHPEIVKLVEHYKGETRFILDTNLTTDVYMQRAHTTVGYKTTPSMLFSFISGKPNIEIDYSDEDTDILCREETGTGYFAANIKQFKRILHLLDEHPYHMKEDIDKKLDAYDVVINTEYEQEYIQCIADIIARKQPQNSIVIPVAPDPNIQFKSPYEEVLFFATALQKGTRSAFSTILDGKYAFWDIAQSVWHIAAYTGNEYLVYAFNPIGPDFLTPTQNEKALTDSSFVLVTEKSVPQLTLECIARHGKHFKGWYCLSKDNSPCALKKIYFAALFTEEPHYVIISGNSLLEIETAIAMLYRQLVLAIEDIMKKM